MTIHMDGNHHAERLGQTLLDRLAKGKLTAAECRAEVKQAQREVEEHMAKKALGRVPYGIKLVDHRSAWQIANEIRRLVASSRAVQWFEDGEGI